MAQSPSESWDWRQHPDFLLNCVSRFGVTLASQIQAVAIGWFIYATTESALALGIVGLAAFLPAILLMLVTGYASDRFDRRLVLSCCCSVMTLATAAQLLHVWSGIEDMWPLYLTVVLYGTGRAFYLPANSAILPNLVPQRHFGNAAAFTTAVAQAANISGPAVGGFLYAISPMAAFGGALTFYALAAASNYLIRYRSKPAPARGGVNRLEHLLAGFRFMWKMPVVLGAITLDLFVVVLGGSVSLLPIFAKDILHVGPEGLGLLRSAPAIGALLVGIVLARNNFMQRKAGPRMFIAVMVFGFANLIFGLSSSFLLSFLVLAMMGAADTASVVVRVTLVQAETPDELRGRVAAVSSLFTTFSNEIGQFRAGTMADFIGAVPAVVLGGAGAIAVAALWMRWFPELGARDHLVPPEPGAAPGR
ncbi:MAG: MFS transporter [Hyphomicrobiaceae bacterium]